MGPLADALAAPDLHVLFFRVSLDIGIAVEVHLTALAQALAEQKQDLVACLANIAKTCDTHLVGLATSDYEAYVQLASDAILLGRTGAERPLAAVLEALGRGVVARTPAAHAAHLQQELDRTHQDVARAIASYGGARARDAWAQIGRASLRCEHQAQLTHCQFEGERTNGRIVIRIGDHCLAASVEARSCLCTHFGLRFQAFHEYLSHAFPPSQANFELLDGFLVWAARWMYPRITANYVEFRFVETMLGVPERRMMDRIEHIAAWLAAKIPDNRFLHFLLEWAACAQDDTVGDVTDALSFLPPRLINDAARIERLRKAFDEDKPERIQETVMMMARELGSVPPTNSYRCS